MKYLALLSLVALVSTPSLAAARLLALCATADGEYTLSVTDYKGKLRLHPSRLLCAVKDSAGRYVASCEADAIKVEETNLGYQYKDKLTDGQRFFLEVSPTNKSRFHLEALVKLDGALVKISDHDMQCSAFNTYLPGR